MMSDEEKVGDKYVCHPPSYRSEKLHKFIERLDNRLEKVPTHHARHARVLGSPVEKEPPTGAKKWILRNSEGLSLEQEQEACASDEKNLRLSEEERNEQKTDYYSVHCAL